DPQLTGFGVRIKLFRISSGEGTEKQCGLMVAAVVPGPFSDWLHHQDCFRFVIDTQSRQVRKCRMRSEPVIGVIRAHLWCTCRNDEPVGGEALREGNPTLSCICCSCVWLIVLFLGLLPMRCHERFERV